METDVCPVCGCMDNYIISEDQSNRSGLYKCRHGHVFLVFQDIDESGNKSIQIYLNMRRDLFSYLFDWSD